MKISSLQKSVSKFMPKKFDEIDSWGMYFFGPIIGIKSVFAIVSYFYPSLTSAGNIGAYQSGAPYGYPLLLLAPSLAHKY
jgi:hypothetical protein